MQHPRRMSKRRTVPAIRDFPPGCGPSSSPRMDPKPKGYPVVVPPDEEEPAPPLQLVNMEVLEDKGLAKNAESVKFDPFEKMGSSPNAETRSHSTRRGVSAIRDFPPFCGPSVSKNLNADDSNPFKMVKEVEKNGADFDGNDAEELKKLDEFGKKIIVHSGVRSFETKLCGGKKVASDRKTVLGVMCEQECPWRHGKGSSKFDVTGSTNQDKGKKGDFCAKGYSSRDATKTRDSRNDSGKKSLKKEKGSAASHGMGQELVTLEEKTKDSLSDPGKKSLKKEKGIAASHFMGQELEVWEEKDSPDLNENMDKFWGFDVNVLPLGHGDLSGHDNDSNVTRTTVRETLRLFQAVYRKLLKEETKFKEGGKARIDVQASKILRKNSKYVNTGKPIFGPVPGIEVGDEFQFWVELNIVGLHRQIMGGIDYVEHNGEILATSVVSSGVYDNELDNTDVLIYTGQGGNVVKTDKEPKDQKLERGNLALRNSCDKKNPVRVILKSRSQDGSCKIYAYYGLYEVETYWQDKGSHGKLVFKFQLRRQPGQPEVPWKEVKKSQKFKIREGLCVDDISYEKESIPICAINTIDDEKPPLFEYRTSMVYPDWCNPIPPVGCDCTNGCSDSKKCSCAVRNKGKIPFNRDRVIVEQKPLVYECGPSCKCPSTCHNRVSQHGIKFQLEIFKTKTKGWGVRSLNSIPSGSFICEYTGELLEDAEAEQRTNDEYLFDIGNYHSDNTLWEELSSIMPEAESSSSQVSENGGFTIDAAHYGNVGRFINHSCSPNLFAQSVLYDHEDNRIPHIMLFAGEDIPRLQELTYHYNYQIDQVYDSNGNIKKKNCFCGAPSCTRRMY